MTEEQIQNRNKTQRERRSRQNNSVTKKYEKTKKGFLMRLYRNMKSRIEGVQKEKYYLYEGKELLSKEDFYKWALNNDQFHKLYDEYEESSYERQKAPSVDRIDSSKGYIVENMEFITTAENSRRGSISRWSNRKTFKETI